MILIIKWTNKIEIYPNLCLIHNYDLDEINKYWYRIKVLLVIQYHHYFLYFPNNNTKNKHSIFFHHFFLFHSCLILFISTFLFLDSLFVMRLVLQRVLSASVVVDGKTISKIGKGLLCLVGIHEKDDLADGGLISSKILVCLFAFLICFILIISKRFFFYTDDLSIFDLFAIDH